MDNPLVSVVIPAYNHERYVEECLQSMLEQTYPELELLIIDDGSRDRTWEKMLSLKEKCEKRFRRVVMERQENRGICVTLNRLLALAHGKYIFDIASDDAAVPDAIETEVRFLEEHPDCVLVVGNDDIIDEDSERIAWDKQHRAVPLGTPGSYADAVSYVMDTYAMNANYYGEDFGSYRSLLGANYIVNGYTYRKSALGEGDFFTPEAPVEDWYLVLQLSKVGKIKYIDRILYHYRWHGTNTVHDSGRMREMVRRNFLFELEHCHDPRYRKYLEPYARMAEGPMTAGLKSGLHRAAEFAVDGLVLMTCFFRKVLGGRLLTRFITRFRSELIMRNFSVCGKYNRFGRYTLIESPERLRMGSFCAVGSFCRLDLSFADNAEIGSHVQIGDNCLIRCSGKLKIGNYCKIRSGTIIDVDGDVVIGDLCVIDHYSMITAPVELSPGTAWPRS